jgi:2-methylcitrate dehydratase PrpD
VRAARLAACGFRATHTILDGERGLARMMGSDRNEPERMVRDLGIEWEVGGLSLKPYPCCRWIHSTLDALREVIARHGVRAADVRGVTVRSIEAFPAWFHGRRPPTMVDAQFSVPHAVAMVVLDRPRAEWWQASNRTDPAALEIVDRVTLEVDPAAQAAWTTIRHSARIPVTVAVETAAGTIEQARRHARGGPDEPLTDEEAERKYRELAEPVLGVAGAARVRELVDRLETLDSVTRLTVALASPLAPHGGARS